MKNVFDEEIQLEALTFIWILNNNQLMVKHRNQIICVVKSNTDVNCLDFKETEPVFVNIWKPMSFDWIEEIMKEFHSHFQKVVDNR